MSKTRSGGSERSVQSSCRAEIFDSIRRGEETPQDAADLSSSSTDEIRGAWGSRVWSNSDLFGQGGGRSERPVASRSISGFRVAIGSAFFGNGVGAVQQRVKPSSGVSRRWAERWESEDWAPPAGRGVKGYLATSLSRGKHLSAGREMIGLLQNGGALDRTRSAGRLCRTGTECQEHRERESTARLSCAYSYACRAPGSPRARAFASASVRRRRQRRGRKPAAPREFLARAGPAAELRRVNADVEPEGHECALHTEGRVRPPATERAEEHGARGPRGSRRRGRKRRGLEQAPGR